MPDKLYEAQVRLLVTVLPVVAREPCFALKGGTAINLFLRNMPRLSVDIDLAYVLNEERATALKEIDAALTRISSILNRQPYGYRVRVKNQQENYIYSLLVANSEATIKIEVSPVLRGVVYPSEMRRIVNRAEVDYGFAEATVLSFADLYAGKIVAALDRQHPRDLFDVMLLLANEGINDALFAAFLVYLISHDGAIARLLDPTLKPLQELYERQFAGMTLLPVTLAELEQARSDMLSAIHRRIGGKEKNLLMSFKRGDPLWELLNVPHAPDLPAVRWKLHNLNQMTRKRHREQLAQLEQVLSKI